MVDTLALEMRGSRAIESGGVRVGRRRRRLLLRPVVPSRAVVEASADVVPGRLVVEARRLARRARRLAHVQQVEHGRGSGGRQKFKNAHEVSSVKSPRARTRDCRVLMQYSVSGAVNVPCSKYLFPAC